MSTQVVMYSTRFCPYCMRARALLDGKGVSYTDIGVDGRPELRRQMVERSGRYTVPQIWIGEQHVGGYDDIALLDRQGRLDQLLSAAP
ncbi:MAG: glutaredoxin 3 [Halioglobus sp.]|nr:glutaredoxin 3 [Halioglobus sp.]